MALLKQKNRKSFWSHVNASGLTALAFGLYGGFFGFEHGIGEILQGNTAINGIRIYAYGPPGLPFPFGREPAMTLIPNYLITGILAALFGLIIMFWSVKFMRKKYGSAVLFLLSIVLLLTGGGYAPFPVLIMASIAAMKIGSKFNWQRNYLPENFRRFLSILWPWFFLLSLLWVPFEVFLGYFFKVGYPFPGYILSYIIPVSMLLTLLTGFAHDSLREDDLK